jgi:hypothetical protein
VHWNLSSLLAVLLLTEGFAAPGPRAIPSNLGDRPADAAPATVDLAWQQTGTIEGVLTIRPRPQRRTVNRYGGAPTVAQIQEIPPLVYVEGRVGPVPEPIRGAVMAQEDTAFAPALLVVPVGTTVRFPNQDPFFHNVFSYSASGRFDLGRYPMGESKDATLDDPGIVKVYCEVHESMRAAIVVVENRFWAEPGEDGGFRMTGVPEGTYTLVAWQADRGETRQEVAVRASGVTRVELEL